jgi:hypothetical protein
MGDPLTDPRAHRLLSADTGEVAALAAAFRKVAGQAQTSAGALRGASGDATWTGPAATRFRSQVGKLPGDLDKVQHSYGEVAAGLDAYERELGPIQARFRSLVTSLGDARSNLSGAQGRLSAAKTSLSTATSAPHAKARTPAVVNAHTAVQTAGGAVGHLQGQVSGLESRGYTLLDEFDTIRGHARSKVSSAAGIAPSQSFWSSMWHDVGNFMSDVGHTFAKLGESVWDAAKSLPSDVAHVVEHPTDLHAWSKLGEDAGTVAGAVAVVAAVVVCPADAVGLEGLAETAATIEGGAETAGTVALTTKTDADTGLVAEGKGSMTTVASDVVGLATGHINPGEEGAETSVTNLESKSGALDSYSASRAAGATPKEAYSNLSVTQRRFVTKSASKLADPGRLTYMRVSTAEKLSGAEVHLRGVKAANTLGHYGVDKVRETVTPEAPEPETEPSCATG